jgi:uncharacterized protein (DUF433 family)
MNYQLYKNITTNPEIYGGKPIIRGMRITVQTIIGHLLAGDSEDDMLESFLYLKREDMESCKEFTSLLLDNSVTLKPTEKIAL